MAHFVGTETPLASGATYTSPNKWADTYDKVTGSVFSSSTGTLYIEQSKDGTNYDVSSSYAITAGDGSGFSEELVLPIWRVRFANSAAAQTAFRLAAKTAFDGR